MPVNSRSAVVPGRFGLAIFFLSSFSLEALTDFVVFVRSYTSKAVADDDPHCSNVLRTEIQLARTDNVSQYGFPRAGGNLAQFPQRRPGGYPNKGIIGRRPRRAPSTWLHRSLAGQNARPGLNSAQNWFVHRGLGRAYIVLPHRAFFVFLFAFLGTDFPPGPKQYVHTYIVGIKGKE